MNTTPPKSGSSPDQSQQVNIPVGPPIVGLFLVLFTAWSLYAGEMTFAMVNVILLVVLAMGTAMINKQ